MPVADFVFLNEPEACAISGRDRLKHALNVLARIVEFVGVTRGSAGASAVVAGERLHGPACPQIRSIRREPVTVSTPDFSMGLAVAAR